MPLIASEIPATAETLEDYSQVLRADPERRTAIAAQLAEGRLFGGIFNERPVAIALLLPSGDQWQLAEWVVHPATRGRGVGKELLRQTRQLLAPATLSIQLRDSDNNE